MKIIIDGRLILPEMTGIGRYLISLITALRVIPGDETFQVWLQSNLPGSHPVWRLGDERISLRQKDFNHMVPEQQWKVPIELARSNHDLFHYPHFDLPFLSQGPLVITIYDLKYIAHPFYFPHHSHGKRLIIRLMMGYSLRRAERVIVISQKTKEDIEKNFMIDASKIDVIPLGIDNTFFMRNSPDDLIDIRKRYGIIRPYFLFVGEMRPHKNIIGVINAYHHYVKHCSGEHHLVISGKRYSDYVEPEMLVETLGIKEKVHFVHITDSDLPVVYQAADVFITLSKYEGFGLPVLEAMASGTPVVASNTTSIPEVVGAAGILVNPDDQNQVIQALSDVIPDGRRRETMIQAGLDRVKEFSWEKCAEQTLAVYRQVIQK